MAPDNRWLVRRRQTWFVVVEVPPSLRAKLGRRIKRTLRTRDINVARARRFAAIAAIRAQIEAARKGQEGDPITLEARAFREALLEARNSAESGSDDPDDPEPWRAQEMSPEALVADQIVQGRLTIHYSSPSSTDASRARPLRVRVFTVPSGRPR